jgi:uncharacterized paraquat-inducible protein A
MATYYPIVCRACQSTMQLLKSKANRAAICPKCGNTIASEEIIEQLVALALPALDRLKDRLG